MADVYINFSIVGVFAPLRVNIVAFDFLGHGESPRPHQSELYTANEVSEPVM